MNQTQDFYRGAIVGAAVGDALGATVDDMPRDEVKEKFGIHRELVGGGRFHSEPGSVGDDTQLSLVVARSLAEHNETDAIDIARRMLEHMASSASGKGLGPTTKAVLGILKPKSRDVFAPARKVWDQKGGDVAGSGCIARTAPVGLLRRLMPRELVEDTIIVSRLTHFDQRCTDSCIAFNFGISYLSSGKDPSKLLFKTWRFLADSRETPEYRESVGEEMPSQDMVKYLKAVNDVAYDDLQPNGLAIETTQAAYWLTLNAIDFEEGLVRAVNLGGDASTLGAVAGALLGARFGVQAIPERWLADIEMKTELEAVADRLWKLAEPKK